MSDTLYGGRRFRTLNVLDEGREGLAIEVDIAARGPGDCVLEQVVAWRGRPQAIRLDKWPGTDRGPVYDLVCGARDRTMVYPAWEAEPECVHRAIQSHLSDGSPQCLRIRVAGAGPGDHCGMAPELQRGAAFMRRWQACRPPRIEPTLKPEVLHWQCRLDGELTLVPDYSDSSYRQPSRSEMAVRRPGYHAQVRKLPSRRQCHGELLASNWARYAAGGRPATRQGPLFIITLQPFGTGSLGQIERLNTYALSTSVR